MEACPDSRRCLPAWMMKPCSSNEVSNTKKQVVESGGLDQVKPIRRKIKTVDSEAAGELRALQRCQGREKVRRKSKDADHSVNDGFDEIEKITWKNVKKVAGRAAPKNSWRKKLENVGSEASSSGITDDEIELTAGKSRALQRCQGREVSRKKRNSADYAAEAEVEETRETTRKNVTKVTARAAPKNSRKRKLDNVELEALSSSTTDDEIELTVEDLVSIAEEIVNAGKAKRQDGRTTKTARYEENSTCPAASTSADTGGLASSTWKGLMQCTAATTSKTPSERRIDKSNGYEEPQQCPSGITMTARYEENSTCPPASTSADTGGPASSTWKGLVQCTETTTNKTPSECRVDKSNGYEEPQQCPSGITMTGDGAQDMLNILLGTMWSKTAAYEKKSEPAAYEKKSEVMEPTTMNVNHAPMWSQTAAYEKKSEAADEKKSEPAAYEKKSEVTEPMTVNVPAPPRKKDWQTVPQVQGELVVAKKSSLKDKIALFL
ncbi:hypothetical protein ACQ4PT_068530 [Festuca glaucescens]